MFSPFVFWPWFTGLIFLIGGLIIARRRAAGLPWLDKLVAVGPILYAAPLAVFAGEHLAGPRILMTLVPAWIPGRLFWAYFVGFALLCAAISIVLMRYVQGSGTLLGIMFFLFVLLIHAPRVATNPRDRISWAVALRDLAFGGAAWALTGTGLLVAMGRFAIAIPLLFFGVEHFLHPNFAPGVPLAKLMPSYVPLGIVWAYLTGAALLATAVALLIRKKDRLAASWTGLLITVLVLIVYAPLLALASQPSQLTEAINYIFDTLLFAGSILIIARALPDQRDLGR